MGNKYRYNLNEIKSQAIGKWLEIIPSIDSRFKNAVSSCPNHVPCPIGTGDKDGFRFDKDSSFDGHAFSNAVDNKQLSDGFGVLRWANGWSLPYVLQQVSEYLSSGVVGSGGSNIGYSSYKTERNYNKKQVAVNKILERSSDAPHDAASLYYMMRGIDKAEDIRSPSLLYHRGCSVYWKGKALKDETGKWKTWPCIIGRASSSKGWCGIHRVYLNRAGGKATGDINRAIKASGLNGELKEKSMLGTREMSGSAVRFGGAGKVLAVGEGIETMLSVALASGSMSVAATGTAGMLRAVEVPDHVEKLIIFADKDANGTGWEAATELWKDQRHLRECIIAMPDVDIPDGQKSVDWLDMYNHYGADCIRKYF